MIRVTRHNHHASCMFLRCERREKRASARAYLAMKINPDRTERAERARARAQQQVSQTQLSSLLEESFSRKADDELAFITPVCDE